MNKLLEGYVGLVDFIAAILGDDAEVLLHDVSNLESSVVAIKNNHISGRNVGAPATDLVLQIIKNETYKDCDFLANYKGDSKSGKNFKSSTYFIKDNNKELIGMVCINVDMGKMIKVSEYINSLLNFEENNKYNETFSESYSHSAKELTIETIYQVIEDFSMPAERMDQDEKIKVVKILNEKGIFLIKGAVSEVAEALKASEATIYRYLAKIKKVNK